MSESLPTVPGNLDTLTAEVLLLHRAAEDHIIQIGLRLIAAKEFVPHGQWLIYLKERLNFTPRWAQFSMKAAEVFGSNANLVSHLPPGKVVLLLDAPEEDRTRLIEQAPSMNKQEFEEAIREANRAKHEAERLAADARREVTETGRRLEKAVRQTAEANELAARARAEAERIRANPPKDPGSEAVRRQQAERIASLEAELQKPGRLGRDIEVLQQELDDLCAKRDDRLNLQEQAFTVNRAVSAILDATTRQRGVIEVAIGKQFSEDWLEPTAIHDAIGLMEAITRDLRRILKDSTPSTIDV